MVSITNGTINYTGVTVGSVAVLDCDEGYRLTFDLNRTCLFTGQWSEGTLSCELITALNPETFISGQPTLQRQDHIN